MYPRRDLIRLAAYKASLRPGIAHRRIRTAAAIARVLRPLAWIDRARQFWRRLSPLAQFAAVPLFLAVRRAFGRSR